MCSVLVRGEASGQRVPGFYSRQQNLLYLAFEWGGGGRLAGRYKRRKPGQAGRYKIFLMWGGGASLPAQELTDWSLCNIITHKRLSPCQTFSGSLDADSIYMALNKTCPRFHFHTGNNETPITLSGITVYDRSNMFSNPWAGLSCIHGEI